MTGTLGSIDWDHPTQPPPSSLLSVQTQANQHVGQSPLDVFQEEIDSIKRLYDQTLKEIQMKATPNQKEVEQNMDQMKQQIPVTFTKILDQTKKIESLLFSQKLEQTITIPRKIKQFEEGFIGFKQDFEVSVSKMKKLIAATNRKLQKQREIKAIASDFNSRLQVTLPNPDELLQQIIDQGDQIGSREYSTMLNESEEIANLMLEIEKILHLFDDEIQTYSSQTLFNVEENSLYLKKVLDEQQNRLTNRIQFEREEINKLSVLQGEAFENVMFHVRSFDPDEKKEEEETNENDLNPDEDYESRIEEEAKIVFAIDAEIQAQLAKFKPESCIVHEIVGYVRGASRKIRIFPDGVFDFKE